jgi:hypothetical protein
MRHGTIIPHPTTARKTVAALVLAALLALLPGGASSTDGFETFSPVRSITLDDTQYVLWHLRLQEPETLQLDLKIRMHDGQMAGYGVWLWKESNPTGTMNNNSGGGVYGAVRAYAQSDALGISLAAHLPACPLAEVVECLGEDHSLSYGPLEPGDWTVLVMTGSDGRSEGELRLNATGEVIVLHESTAPAFLDREEQFTGGGTILVETGLTRTKMVQDVAVAHDIKRTFFGYFLGSSETDLLRMSYEAPTGIGKDRTFYRFDGTPPGAYRFHVVEDLELTWGSYWVLGADVNLAGS